MLGPKHPLRGVIPIYINEKKIVYGDHEINAEKNAVNRIARKVAEGKKLSDQEIVILYLDIIMRSNEKRFNDLREYTDKKFESIDRRFEAIDKRFNDLREYTD